MDGTVRSLPSERPVWAPQVVGSPAMLPTSALQGLPWPRIPVSATDCGEQGTLRGCGHQTFL